MTATTQTREFFPARFAGDAPTPFDCELLVPTACRAVPIAAGTAGGGSDAARFAPLARFASPDHAFAIELGASLTPREVDVADFGLIDADEHRGRVVQQRRWHDGPAASAELFVEPRDATGQLERHRLIKNGSRLLRVAVRFSAENADHARLAAISCGSLRRLSNDAEANAERIVRWHSVSTPRWTVDHPESWTPTGVAHSADGGASEVRLTHRMRDRPCGELRVSVLAAQEHGEVRAIRAFAKRLAESGVELEGAPIAEQVEGNGRVVHTYSPFASAAGRDVCVAAVAERRGSWTACVALHGPSRKTAPFLWAVAKRGFEIARSTLTLSGTD